MTLGCVPGVSVGSNDAPSVGSFVPRRGAREVASGPLHNAPFLLFSDIFPGLTLLARYFFPVDSSRGAPRSTVSIHTVPGTLQPAPRSSEVDFVRSSSVISPRRLRLLQRPNKRLCSNCLSVIRPSQLGRKKKDSFARLVSIKLCLGSRMRHLVSNARTDPGGRKRHEPSGTFRAFKFRASQVIFIFIQQRERLLLS